MMDRVASLDMVRKCLTGLDYAPGCIEREYTFPAGRNLVMADIVAFSNMHRKDLATSCIAVQFCANGNEMDKYKRDLPYTAAPLAILPTPNSVFIQPQTFKRDGGPAPKEHRYDDFTEYVNRNRYSFLPTTLQAVKKEGRQLTLFEFDPSLYKYASEVSKKELVRRFEEAINLANDLVARLQKGRKEENARYTKHIVMVAIRILAARTLEDKKIVPSETQATDAEALLRKAAGKFPGYFKWGEIARIGNTTLGRQVADIILDSLGKDYTYRAISGEQLGYFYEHTFVSKQLRKNLGIYYTPQKVAKEMLKVLPIEEIRPEDRFVLDGTCGSGGLLTAAYDRLFDLMPNSLEESEKHDFLVQRIRGVDKDPFAVEIAKKSLFLASLPFGNSWTIEEDNFLDYDIRKSGTTPRIIVANPPFEEIRKEALVQKATKFLEKYIGMLPEGGLISIVLPESFLQNKSCRESRKLLLGSTEILEMWQLPEGAFPMAQCGTVIVCGRKPAKKSSRSIRFKRLFGTRSLRETAFEGIRFDVSYVSAIIEDWRSDSEHVMNTSFLSEVWKKLETFDKVGDFFHIRNGLQGGTEDLHRIHFFRSGGSDYKFLNSAEQLERYSINWEWGTASTKIYHYPGNLLRPRLKLAEIFKSKDIKLLVNANMAPTSHWRLQAAIDREGYFVSQGMHLLFAKKGTSANLEVLAAVLNGHVANAFIDNFARKRWITEKTIEGIPMPRLSDLRKSEIIEAVRTIENAKKRMATGGILTPPLEMTIETSTKNINKILFEGYGLSDVERKRISNFLEAECEEDGGATVSSSPLEFGKVTGRIYGVNPESQTMQVWIIGYGNAAEPEELAIPDNLPGWALRGNTDFEATIALDRGQKPASISEIFFLDFSLLKNAYLSDSEIASIMISRRG